jgi:transcriptional regulator with XRE-family HTH domain
MLEHEFMGYKQGLKLESDVMITANQLRAARALLNIDQRQMAELANLSVPTIQRMEASDGVVRGNVDSLMKLVSALENAGIELINPGVASSTGGRGVRLREHVTTPKLKTVRQQKLSSSRALERAR